MWDLKESLITINLELSLFPFNDKAVLTAIGDREIERGDVLSLVCNDWLGMVGGVLAMLGVVAAPITSGDTAFRSARLIIAQAIKLGQRQKMHRIYICVPLFAASLAML